MPRLRSTRLRAISQSARARAPGLLDILGVSAAVAFSLRRLRAAYTGPAVRIRRFSDNAELDIGFLSGGGLDTDSMLAFLDSSAGLVVRWYDQSGKGLDVFQVTAANQPRLSNTGNVIDTMNGQPAVFWSSSSIGLGRASAIGAATDSSMFWVGSISSINNRVLFSIGSNAAGVNGGDMLVAASPFYPSYGEGGFRTALATYDTFFTNTPYVISRVTTGALPSTAGATPSNLNAFINGTAMPANPSMNTSGFGGWSNLQLGGITNGTTTPASGLIGYMSEAIAFASALTGTQRQTVERNQGTYYGITVA